MGKTQEEGDRSKERLSYVAVQEGALGFLIPTLGGHHQRCVVFLHEEEEAFSALPNCTQAPEHSPEGEPYYGSPGKGEGVCVCGKQMTLTFKVHQVCLIPWGTRAASTQESRSGRGFESRAADSWPSLPA